MEWKAMGFLFFVLFWRDGDCMEQGERVECGIKMDEDGYGWQLPVPSPSHPPPYLCAAQWMRIWEGGRGIVGEEGMVVVARRPFLHSKIPHPPPPLEIDGWIENKQPTTTAGGGGTIFKLWRFCLLPLCLLLWPCVADCPTQFTC
jgi:hypothetical protein